MSLPILRPLLSWAGLLSFLALSMQAIEKTTFRYPLPWALLLFRVGFLAAGVVLLLRFISFRKQKSLERMASAYAHAAGSEFSSWQSLPLNEALNLALCLGIVMANLFAVGLGWDATEHFSEWKNAIALDGLSGILLWVWAAKACWLRAQRKREILKMNLDDLRSKQKPTSIAPLQFARPGLQSRLVFGFALTLGVAVLLGITQSRWQAASGLAAKTKVARCMEPLWQGARIQYERDGTQKIRGENALSCLANSSMDYEAALTHDENGVTLSVWEKPMSDGFGDGVKGNQGLRISTEGKLLEVSRIRSF